MSGLGQWLNRQREALVRNWREGRRYSQKDAFVTVAKKVLTKCWNTVYTVTRFVVVLPWALLGRIRRKNVWLVAERPDQARDNGYSFFRYVREQHPEQPVYYIIRKGAPDEEKVKRLGPVIDYNSWRHYYYFCLSRIHISAHTDVCSPREFRHFKLEKLFGIRRVFVQHGICYALAEFCFEKYAKIDLFCCGGEPEYHNVLKNYGYQPEQVVYTGIPRFDGLYNIRVDPKMILLIPTWRNYLAQNQHTVFKETTYYKVYQSLVSSRELHKFLQENDLKFVFYLHNNMRKYVDEFKTDCPNIEVVYRDDTYDIQELLKTAALMITDYSTVHFDFAYMGKPVIYYQFDQAEFYEKQWQKSEFTAEATGFGPVAYQEAELLSDIRDAYARGFTMEEKYHQRMQNFFPLHDDHNCERIYREILKLEETM